MNFRAVSILPLCGLLAAFAASAHAQTILQDFNAGGGGTFSADFNQNGPNAPNFFQNTVGGGVGNSNAVDLTSNSGDATAIYNKVTFDLSTGTPTATISAYFRNQQNIGGGTAAGAFQLGFASDTTTAFNGGNSFLSARVQGDGSVQFQSLGTNGSGNTGTSAPSTLSNGNFYYLTVSFTRTATPNTFSGSVSLFNSDANGVLGTLLATSSSTTLTNTDIYADNTVFAGFRAAGATGSGINGANLVDNFSAAVPEPSTYAGGGFLVGLFALSQRKRILRAA